jgi:hypothetical protein
MKPYLLNCKMNVRIDYPQPMDRSGIYLSISFEFDKLTGLKKIYEYI